MDMVSEGGSLERYAESSAGDRRDYRRIREFKLGSEDWKRHKGREMVRGSKVDDADKLIQIDGRDYD